MKNKIMVDLLGLEAVDVVAVVALVLAVFVYL